MRFKNLDKLGIVGLLWNKHGFNFLVIIILLVLSFVSELFPVVFKKSEKKGVSLDSLIPKNFALVDLYLDNGADIINHIGSYGVVDLYIYSKGSNKPIKQVARAVKVLSPKTQDGAFGVVIPENEVSHLLQYPNSLYAVVQNPNKGNSKIFRKKTSKPLVVIEESF